MKDCDPVSPVFSDSFSGTALFEQELLAFVPKDPIPLSLSSLLLPLCDDPWDGFCDGGFSNDCDDCSVDVHGSDMFLARASAN